MSRKKGNMFPRSVRFLVVLYIMLSDLLFHCKIYLIYPLFSLLLLSHIGLLSPLSSLLYLSCLLRTSVSPSTRLVSPSIDHFCVQWKLHVTDSVYFDFRWTNRQTAAILAHLSRGQISSHHTPFSTHYFTPLYHASWQWKCSNSILENLGRSSPINLEISSREPDPLKSLKCKVCPCSFRVRL